MSNFRDCDICGINYNANTFNVDNPHKCTRPDIERHVAQLKSDVTALGLRLLAEDGSTFSIEVFEVMSRWRDRLLQQLDWQQTSTEGGH